MTTLYIKYSPSRRGLTGTEYLAGFVDEQYPTVSFSEVISDGFNRFGILSGSGDDLSKMLMAASDRFSIKQLSELEFIGYCRANYNPIEMDGETPPTFSEFMSSFGISVTDELVAVKEMKKNMFKEIVRKKLETDNESIADIMKALLLLVVHYDNLSQNDKDIVDAKTTQLKNVYSASKCITSYSSFVDDIVAVVDSYYDSVNSLESQNDVSSALSITYE